VQVGRLLARNGPKKALQSIPTALGAPKNKYPARAHGASVDALARWLAPAAANRKGGGLVRSHDSDAALCCKQQGST